MSHFMIRIIVLGAVVLAVALGGAAEEAGGGLQLYVATNGNDAWSGKLPEPNADGTDGPLATLGTPSER